MSIMDYSSVVDSIEIYENERAWIGGGFSKRGLLPNDRGRYSTLDGSLSFKTIQEAAETLLLPGSSYLDDNSADFCASEDEPPWYYARDFSRSAMENKQIKRGPLHWVRFRRLKKPKRLDPATLFPRVDDQKQLLDTLQKCSFCDSQVIQQVSDVLVEVTAYLSLIHSPNRLTQAAEVAAKRKVLQFLGQKTSAFQSPSITPRQRLAALRKELEQVANKERDKPQYLLSKVEFYNSRQNDPNWKERCQHIANSCFSERSIISGWVVRLLDDPEFQFHCQQVDCGTTCQFFQLSCPNEGCSEILSQKYLPQHQGICDYKIVSCSCGESVRRVDLQRHSREACPLRTENCPFHRIGCVKICQAHELPDHMETHVGSHLLLALDRIMEFQTVIRDLNVKVLALQQENQQLHRTVQVYHEASVKETANIQRKVAEVGKKLNNLENSSRKEFKQIRDHSRGI